MEILPRPAPCPLIAQGALNILRLSPGDIIEARILRIAPDGKAHFQIGTTKVFSAHAFGGRVGEVFRFEVQAPAQAAIQDQHAQPRLSIMVNRNGATFSIKLLLLRAAPEQSDPFMTGRDSKPAGTYSLRPAATPFSFDATPSVLLDWSSSHLQTSMAALKAKWVKYLRQRMVTRLRPLSRTLALPPHRVRDLDGNLSSVGPNMPITVESAGGASDFEYAADFWIDAARERYLRVKLKLGDRNQNRSKTGPQNMITASLILDLEPLGAIEIELKMGQDQIWIDFMVENESAQEKVESRMADINAALGELVKGVFCRVLTDRLVAGMLPAAGDNDQTDDPRKIDLKI